MKKIIAVCLCLSMFLTACGTEEPQAATQEETVEVTVGETSVATEPPAESTEPAVITINETVLVDEAGVKITATGLEYGGYRGPEVKLLIENNTDTDLTFQIRNVSVNGCMVDSSMSEDVAAGKKANSKFSIYQSSLDLYDINTIANLEFFFHIFTSQGWDDYLDTSPICLETSAAGTSNYTYTASGELLYQGNDVTIRSLGIADDLENPGVWVSVYNGSAEPLTFQVRSLSVNGYMSKSVFSLDVASGKHAIERIKLKPANLEENGITEIENVEFNFHFFNSNDWGLSFDSDLITVAKDGEYSNQDIAQNTEPVGTSFSYGNLIFSFRENQEAIDVNDDGLTSKITPSVSAVGIYYSEIIDYLGGDYTAALQHASFTKIENRVSSEYSYFSLPILTESVEFTIVKTTGGKYWMIGTFYDDQYVYTITYCTTDTTDTELVNFTDFLARIEPVEGELEITSYTH